MADFVFRLRADVDTDTAIKRLQGLEGSVEDIEAAVADLVDTTGKSTNELRIDIVTTEKGRGLLQKVEKGVVNLDKAQQERIKTLNKLTATERGSLTSISQRLSREKQLRNALTPGTAAFNERAQKVLELEVAQRRAQGIQDGSVNAIRAEARALQQQLGNLKLNAAEREKLTQAISRNAQAERDAQGIQKGSIADLRAQQAEQQRLVDTLAAGSTAQRQAAEAVKRLGNEIQAAQPKTQSLIAVFNKLATVQAGIQAITSIIGQITGSIDKVVKRIKEVEAFNLALRNLGVSATDSAKAFNQAAATAGNLGAPLQQVEKAYKRITPALRDIGASASETDRFIANLTARTQILGLTTEESGRLQEAFAQVLAKGKLQAEELTQQIAEVDGAFRTQFAAALGVTSAELQELTTNGQITASVFVKGVNSMSNGVDILRGNIESGNATIQQLQNLIANINVKTLEEIGRSIEPGIRALLEASRVLAEFVQEVAQSSVGQLLFDAFNQVAGAAKNFITALTGLLSALVAIAGPIAEILRYLSPLIGVFVVFVATIKTVSLTVGAFIAVQNAAKAAAGGLGSGIQQTALAVVRFGAAIKALATGNFGAFINNLTGSFIALGNALVGGDLAKAGAALGLIGASATTSAGATAAATAAVNSLSASAAGSVPILSSLSATLGTASVTSSTFVATSANLAAALGTTTATAGTASGSLLGLGASAGIAAGATGAAGAASGGAAVGIGAAGVAAGGATITFASLAAAASALWAALLPLLPFILVLVAAIAIALVTFAAITGAIADLNFAAKSSGPALNQLRSDLKRLDKDAKGAQPALEEFPSILDRIRLSLRGAGFAREAGKFRAIVQGVDADFKKAGLGGLTDFSNASNLTGKQAGVLVGKLGALASAQDKVAASLQQELDQRESQGKLFPGERAQLEQQIELAKEKSAGFQILQRRLAAYTAEQRQAALAEADFETKVEAVKAALEAKDNQIEQAQTKLNTEQLNDYNAGLITQAELELNTGATAVAAAKQKLASIEEEQAALSTAAAQNLQDANTRQQLAEELAAKKIEAEAAVAEAQKAYREAEIARIQEVVREAENLAGIYLDTASQATSAIDGMAGAVGDALAGIADAINTQAAIEFMITGDETVINKAVDAQGKILAFEYQIGRVKNDIAQKQREAELALQQLKLQGLLAEAQADPNAESRERRVAALQNALTLTNQIGALQRTQAAAEDLALQSQTQQQQQALNLQREALGLPPIKIVEEKSIDQLSADFDNLYQQATTQAQGIGAATTAGISEGIDAAKGGVSQLGQTVEAIQKQQEEFNKKLSEGVQQLGEAARAIADNTYGVEIGEAIKEALGGAFDSFEQSLKNAPKLMADVNKAAGGIGSTFEGVDTKVEKLNTTLDNTAGKLRTLQGLSRGLPGGGTPGSMAQQLATGGPVTAGSQYFVNDGGGREAFVDMRGRAQLLPASRNIKWRAPRDGFVLPAPMTKELVQNSKINAKIQAVSGQGRPRAVSQVEASGVSSSGNLIKQMGAMMSGGSTQRITNHVTIQSQNPVTDASKIMANVARMKARRGAI